MKLLKITGIALLISSRMSDSQVIPETVICSNYDVQQCPHGCEVINQHLSLENQSCQSCGGCPDTQIQIGVCGACEHCNGGSGGNCKFTSGCDANGFHMGADTNASHYCCNNYGDNWGDVCAYRKNSGQLDTSCVAPCADNEYEERVCIPETSHAASNGQMRVCQACHYACTDGCSGPRLSDCITTTTPSVTTTTSPTSAPSVELFAECDKCVADTKVWRKKCIKQCKRKQKILSDKLSNPKCNTKCCKILCNDSKKDNSVLRSCQLTGHCSSSE